MALGGWQVIARDPDLARRGYLPWTALTLDHNHAAVSSWTLTLPATPAVMARLGAGWGIIIIRDGTEILSGPIEDDGPRSWTAADDGEGPGAITVTGADDLVIVANELAYPDPTKNVAGQVGGTYQDVQSGAAETVIKHYVSTNVGVGRASARGDSSAPDVRLVTVATDQARGDTVSFSARFDGLVDILSTISAAGSNIGAQVLQDGTDLVFDCYLPVDRSARLRFSRDTGNLTSASTTVSMPTLTHAVVLGSSTDDTDDSSQVLVERKASASAESWRMIVRGVVDSAASDTTTDLDAAGDAALASGMRQYARDVTIVETAQVRYPANFGRGDLVTIVDPTRPGTAIVDVISNVHVELDASAGTELVQLNVGLTDSTITGDDLTDQLKVLKRRVNELQRRTP